MAIYTQRNQEEHSMTGSHTDTGGGANTHSVFEHWSMQGYTQN